MPWPGFEPGLLRPQRRVLTTRRSRLARDMECCAWNVDGIFDFMSGRLDSNLKLTFVSRFSWCSGYHICLTHRRSPVRSRAKTAVPRGLTARISGFHPGGPGSTPGVGTLFSWIFFKGQIQILPFMNIFKFFWRPKRCSVTGNRTRATWVRARYPNH